MNYCGHRGGREAAIPCQNQRHTSHGYRKETRNVAATIKSPKTASDLNLTQWQNPETCLRRRHIKQNDKATTRALFPRVLCNLLCSGGLVVHIQSFCDSLCREVIRSCYGQMILCDNSGRRQTRGCKMKEALQVARNWQKCVIPQCNSHNSLPRPQSCSRDVDGRLWGAGGWQPKSSQQHLTGETSLLGVTRSPTAVARSPEFKSSRRGPTSPTELRPRKPSASYLGYFQRGVFHQERKRHREHRH